MAIVHEETEQLKPRARPLEYLCVGKAQPSPCQAALGLALRAEQIERYRSTFLFLVTSPCIVSDFRAIGVGNQRHKPLVRHLGKIHRTEVGVKDAQIHFSSAPFEVTDTRDSGAKRPSKSMATALSII